MRTGDILGMQPDVVVVCLLQREAVVLPVVPSHQNTEAVAGGKFQRRCGRYRLLLSLLKKDFTQLIEYWCVDTDYDGRVLKPKASFCADKKAVAKEAVIPQNPGKTVAVKVMDVFGNEGMLTFDF